MRKIRKGQYGFPVITISPKEYLDKGAEVILKAMEPIGKAITKFAAAPQHGATSYATTGQYRTKEKAKEQRLKEKAFEEHIGPALSPSNHVVAWTQGSWNPKVGQQKIAEWGPLAQLGSLGVDAVGFKYIPKGVKATAKGTKAAVTKAVKNSKAKEVSKTIDKVVDKGFKPRLSSDENLYRTTTDKEVSVLKSGRFKIHPNGGNHGAYGWRRGEPFYQPGSWVESKMIGKRNGISEGVDNPTYLVAPIKEDLQVRIGSGGKYGEPVPATEVPNGTKPYYHPSGGLAYDRSSVAFLPGDEIPNEIIAWSKKNGKWQFELIEQPKQIYRAKDAKQRRVISEGTYPWYRGKQHSVKEVVNPDGTVNPRQAMRIQHEVSEQFPGSYRMERRLENRKDHKTDPTTYHHTKNVASSAWGLDVPYGFTKHDQMVAALGHDFGKMVAGDGHAQIGADLVKQVFPDLTDAQYTAIAEHMGTPKTSLGKATKAADIDNGRSVGLNSSPQTDTYVEGLSNDLEQYALRDNTGGSSKITVPDVYKSLTEAEEYKGSRGYKDLVHRAQKEAKEMGLPFSSDLYIGVNNYIPNIKLSPRPKGKLGGYRRSTNTIELDPDQLNPIEGKYVPFHEGLHWQRVGTPELNSPLYNRWKQNMRDEQAWHDFYHSVEHNKLKYEDNAKAYAIKKVKEALYEDADPYLYIPGELQINGLEAGRAIGLEPFAEYPGYSKALEAVNKAREYNKWLYDVKAGTIQEMKNFWKILTGNYIPSVSIPLTTGYTLYNIFNQPQQQLQYQKQGGKTRKPSQQSVHRPWGHRSILDNGWQSTKQLKNKKNVYGK